MGNDKELDGKGTTASIGGRTIQTRPWPKPRYNTSAVGTDCGSGLIGEERVRG